MVMKKHILVAILSVLVCITAVAVVDAKSTTNPALTSAIKMYKTKNYSGCYVALQDVVKKDPSNALAYYYLAMTSAQIGNKDDAIANYTKVITLSPNGVLGKYATKGKICLEEPDKCHEPEVAPDPEDSFIRGAFGSGFSDKARSEYEKQKIENLMREMNRDKDVQPQSFKEYRDFSSQAPTNDEIVSAIRVLQKAGLVDLVRGNNAPDLSLLTGTQGYNNENAVLNMLTRNGSSSLNPQVIQSLLTNQMSIDF